MKSLTKFIQSEKEALRNEWPKAIAPILVFLTILFLLLFRSGDMTAKADQSIEFNLNVPNTHWVIPISKKGAGSDLNDKVAYFYAQCLKSLNRPQCLRVAGLVDHESAGTWSPTVKGDGGCSTGIAQWNNCAGSRRKAPDTFEKQVDLIIREMGGEVRKAQPRHFHLPPQQPSGSMRKELCGEGEGFREIVSLNQSPCKTKTNLPSSVSQRHQSHARGL